MASDFPIVYNFQPRTNFQDSLKKRSIRVMDLAHKEADRVVRSAVTSAEKYAYELLLICNGLLSDKIRPNRLLKKEVEMFVEWQEETGLNIFGFDDLNSRQFSKREVMRISCEIRRTMFNQEYAGYLIGLFYYLMENAYYRSIYEVQHATGLASDLWGIKQESDVPQDYGKTQDLIDLSNRLSKTLFTDLAKIFDRSINLNLEKVFRSQVDDELNSAGYAITRQVHTETTSIVGDATIRANKRMSVKYYIYLTERDALVCGLCMPLNGQKFEVSQKETGKNYPPIHPNCRCQTMPFIDKQTIEFLKKQAEIVSYSYRTVPISMSFADWLGAWGINLIEVMQE